MGRPWIVWAVRSAGALIAGAIGFTMAMNLLDTEAGGGRLTGPLIRLCLAGSVALVACGVLVFTRRRVVSLVALTATLPCLPLFVYRIAPGALAWTSGAPSSVAPAQATTPDPLAIAGVVAVLLVWTAHLRFRQRPAR